jgi:Tfp pilus assembly protein PilE
MLLLILGAIIVGIAVAAGFAPSHENAINSNRDALTQDLMEFAARAQQYYHASGNKGGGDGSFTDIAMTKLTNKSTNENGSISIGSVEPQQMVLIGKGMYLVGTDSVEVRCTVTATGYAIAKIH